MQNILLSSTIHKILVSSLTLLILLWYQFMDFWFSFLAVVSTFVYLTILSETTKRAIHIIAAIISDCSKKKKKKHSNFKLHQRKMKEILQTKPKKTLKIWVEL